jgi:hypothetical protein
MIPKNPPKPPSPKNLDGYIQNDLWAWMKDITTGMIRLDFLDNFQSQRFDNIIILAGQIIELTNNRPYVPSARIIIRQIGDGVVTDGSWSIQTLRLMNNGIVPITISVIFFK